MERRDAERALRQLSQRLGDGADDGVRARRRRRHRASARGALGRRDMDTAAGSAGRQLPPARLEHLGQRTVGRVGERTWRAVSMERQRVEHDHAARRLRRHDGAVG